MEVLKNFGQDVLQKLGLDLRSRKARQLLRENNIERLVNDSRSPLRVLRIVFTSGPTYLQYQVPPPVNPGDISKVTFTEAGWLFHLKNGNSTFGTLYDLTSDEASKVEERIEQAKLRL